jgi:hypothetical protein
MKLIAEKRTELSHVEVIAKISTEGSASHAKTGPITEPAPTQNEQFSQNSYRK